MNSAAEMLTGKELADGWRVLNAVKSKGSTGGCFSVGYIVKANDGRKAFLKALDFSSAFSEPDPAEILNALTEAFLYERTIMEICKERRMDRVVRILAQGTVVVPEAAQPNTVQYLIFELADSDVRRQADVMRSFDTAWSLRALHHISTGMFQLHNQRIAHQDLKPSNVMVFENRYSKIGDLGRASWEGKVGPHEELQIAGDCRYAPPELLYGYVDPDTRVRRFGCDAYLMGSMVFFFFTGSMITPHIIANLREAHKPENWQGRYQDVLVYLRESFANTVDYYSHIVAEQDNELSVHLTRVLQQLCEPDPSLRGHPRTRAARGNPYSLERYISLFDILAKKAELRLPRIRK